MIVRNDIISEASFASWSPSTITNLSDWWVASSGLNLSGSAVNSWTGLNSTSFVPATSVKAAYISSDPNLNDYPSIQLNPSSTSGDNGYWVDSAYSPLGKTMIMIGYMIAPRGENCVMSIDTVDGTPYVNGSGAHASLFGHDGGDYWAYYAGSGGSNTSFLTLNYPSANNSFLYAIVVADAISAKADYYTSISPSSNNSLFTKTGIETGIDTYNTLILGGYNNAYGETPKMNISEVISLNGALKDIDKINLDNYVSNKYFNL